MFSWGIKWDSAVNIAKYWEKSYKMEYWYKMGQYPVYDNIMEVKAHLVFLEALQGDRKGLQLNLLVISINVDRLLIKMNSD